MKKPNIDWSYILDLVLIVPYYLPIWLFRRAWLEVRYVCWRISGGFARAKDQRWDRQEKHQDESRIVDIEKNMRVVLAGDSSENGIIKVRAYKKGIDPAPLEAFGKEKWSEKRPISLWLHWSVKLSDDDMRFGCHGRYSLPRATFYGEMIGGDPVCGGGIKTVFPTYLRELIERFRLRRELAKKRVEGWAIGASHSQRDFLTGVVNEYGHLLFYFTKPKNPNCTKLVIEFV